MQNGLIALGAFYALSHHVNGWLVLLFCCLFWLDEKKQSGEKQK